ncbi:MAG TPA: 3-dehydroquinate synthase [Desulfobacteria bacterium]|nr:3-dehydroquinate synthase [Desulfobacteria bacterium]
MEKIKVMLGAGYDICIGNNILTELGTALKKFRLSPNALLIVNTTVECLYGDRVATGLAEAGFTVARSVIPDGEEYKTLTTAAKLYDAAVAAKLDRNCPVIALGGGVTGDLAGFVAATYMRGLPFVQVPTTLLAQVDSSIGGKVAVNHPKGKNLIGSFYQPILVWSDTETLKSLPERELLTGLAENIKHGVIAGPDLLSFIYAHLTQILASDTDTMIELVKRSCRVKQNVVEQDEQETGVRAILNFGHTFGHAVENVTGYTVYRHGEAVALGMAAASRLARRIGVLAEKDEKEIIDLLVQAGLPCGGTGLDPEQLAQALVYDKKTVAGKLTFVLPRGIGKVEIFQGIDHGDVLWALKTIC